MKSFPLVLLFSLTVLSSQAHGQANASSAATELQLKEPAYFENGPDAEVHLSLDGLGLFRVSLPDGSYGYTRDGRFHVDANGTLANASGHWLDPNITIPPNATTIWVSPTGEFSYLQDGVVHQAGCCNVYKFSNISGMRRLQKNLFATTLESGEELVGLPGMEGFGKIRRVIENTELDSVQDLARVFDGLQNKPIEQQRAASTTAIDSIDQR